jgi:acyl carrier protein|tara:strand:+ start:225 stop:473 length:249 start_codon:yes stop_codon:yes gene_type:complete
MKKTDLARAKIKKILVSNDFKFNKKIQFDKINIITDISIDSLKLLSIINDIEKVFKIKFPIDFFKKIKDKNIGFIIQNIIKK